MFKQFERELKGATTHFVHAHKGDEEALSEMNQVLVSLSIMAEAISNAGMLDQFRGNLADALKHVNEALREAQNY
jgi:hypothetical protein